MSKKPKTTEDHQIEPGGNDASGGDDAQGATEVVIQPEVEVAIVERVANDREGEPAPDGEQQEPTDQGDDEQSGISPEAPYGLKVDGTPAKKRGPRPKGTSDESDKQRARLRSVTPSRVKVKADRTQSVTVLAAVNYQAMGEMFGGLFFQGGEALFGDDWTPEEGERLAVNGAMRDYLKAKQMRDLPPGFALCMVLGMYSIKRIQRPKVQSKLALVGAWVRDRFSGLKGYAAKIRGNGLTGYEK